MKKRSLIDLRSLRKTVLIVFLSIMLLSFYSCATFINSLLDNSICIEPGCDRDTTRHSSYCIIHSDKEPVEVDVRNPYKLHKSFSEEEVKSKVKISRKNY